MSTTTEHKANPRVLARASAECKPLLDAATSELYRNNAFRILCLPMDASLPEIKKKSWDLQVQAKCGRINNKQTPFFARTPAPTWDEIGAAAERLQDPEKRLIDGFFWFWPEEFGQSSSDPAIQALAKGDDTAALEMWGQKSGSLGNSIAARHNLVIYSHLKAMERELESSGDDTARRKEIEGCWRNSFQHWERLAADGRLWEAVARRMTQIDKARLKPSFRRSMEASLPLALLKVNAEFALGHAEAGNTDLARCQMELMRESGQGEDAVEKAAELVLTPARNRLKEWMQRAHKRAKTKPLDAAAATHELLTQARQTLDLFDLFFPQESNIRNELFDDVARLCNRLQIDYHNATKDDKTCLEILNAILPLATSIDLRQLIEKDITETCARLELVADRSTSATSPKPVGDAGGEHARMERGAYDGGIYVVVAFIAEIVCAGILALSFIANILKIPCDDTTSWIVGGLAGLGIALLVFWNRWKCIEAFSSQFCSGVANLSLLYVPVVALIYANWRGVKKVFDRSEWVNNGANKSSRIALVGAAIVLVLGFTGVGGTGKNSSGGSSHTPVASSPPAGDFDPVKLGAVQEPWKKYQAVAQPVSQGKQDSSSKPTYQKQKQTADDFLGPAPGTADSSSKPTYRVPNSVSAQLDRDSRTIDDEKAKSEKLESRLSEYKESLEREKAKAEDLESQLESLGGQIDRARIYLDETSQSDVDEFNRKVNRYNAMLRNVRVENELVNQMVDSHNALLEQLRAQNRVVNRMVDSYNQKLQNHGR